MFQIERQYTFDAAHQLPHLEPPSHKCRRLHGHTYTVIVILSHPGDSLDHRGMVMDFAELDDIVKPWIQTMDHRFLASGREDIVRHLPALDVVLIGVPTTAENLAQFLGQKILQKVDGQGFTVTVAVKETPKSVASWASESAR